MDSTTGLALLCLALLCTARYSHARPSSSLFNEAARIDAAATDPNDDSSDSVPIEPRFQPPPQQAIQPLEQFINTPDARNLTLSDANSTLPIESFTSQAQPDARGGGYGGYDGGGGYGGDGYGHGGGYGGYGGGGFGFAPGILFGEESGFFQGPPPHIICGLMGGQGAPYWVLHQCQQLGIPIGIGGGFGGGGIIGRSSKPDKTKGYYAEEKRAKSLAARSDQDSESSEDAKFD